MNALLPLFIQENENEDEEFDLLEELRRLAGSVGWEPLLADAFALLSSQAQKGYWHAAILVIYGSLSAQPTLPCTLDECIARLYVCLEQSAELAEHDGDRRGQRLNALPHGPSRRQPHSNFSLSCVVSFP